MDMVSQKAPGDRQKTLMTPKGEDGMMNLVTIREFLLSEREVWSN